MILNIKRIVLVFIICGFFTVVFFDMKKDADEIKKYKYETICYVYKIDGNRNGKSAYVYYFYDNKKYYTVQDIKKSNNKYFKKYFSINISKKRPNINEVLFDLQVTDTSDILRAGFSMDEPPIARI